MPKRTRPYREFLLEELRDDPVFASEYLNEAHRESRTDFLKALRNVAEARRMAVVAEEAGVNRESLYKTLSEDGNPRLETFDSILGALGLEYEIKPREVSPITQTGSQTSQSSPDGNTQAMPPVGQFANGACMFLVVAGSGPHFKSGLPKRPPLMRSGRIAQNQMAAGGD